jgi:hypothetical protein
MLPPAWVCRSTWIQNIGLRAAEIKKRAAKSGLSPRAHLQSEETSGHALNVVIIIAADLCVARVKHLSFQSKISLNPILL